MPKIRINVYIDGFNLYNSTLQHTHPDCRWLNLLELSKRLINPETEEIQTVYYFSALTTWIPERAKKPVAMIVPYPEEKKGKRKIGILDGKATITFRNDFEMTTEELCNL